MLTFCLYYEVVFFENEAPMPLNSTIKIISTFHNQILVLDYKTLLNVSFYYTMFCKYFKEIFSAKCLLLNQFKSLNSCNNLW